VENTEVVLLLLQVFVLTPCLKRCGLKPKWKLLQGFLPVLIVSGQTHDDAWPWSNYRIVLSRLEESWKLAGMLMTIFKVMLPQSPEPKSFPKLMEEFKTTKEFIDL
jgi:hypothetical protein